MTRSSRLDVAGRWHHVMNRGMARRTLFETVADIRFFLSQLARQVRAGRVEVHAYCVMTTHFHLLVRSVRGELSPALQSITLAYVRYFNRSRRRDGPLVRGRFLSCPVQSRRYLVTLVRYIDDNPVVAGIVPLAALYPHGSARHHSAERGPKWLARSFIEEQRSRATLPGQPLRSYESAFGTTLTLGERWLVQRRLACAARSEEPLDQLFEMAPPEIKDWMLRKAALADGTAPGYPIVDPDCLERALAQASHAIGAWPLRLSRKSSDAWIIARVGMLRELCGLSLEETARRCERSYQNTAKLHGLHRMLLQNDAEYSERLAHLAYPFESK